MAPLVDSSEESDDSRKSRSSASGSGSADSSSRSGSSSSSRSSSSSQQQKKSSKKKKSSSSSKKSSSKEPKTSKSSKGGNGKSKGKKKKKKDPNAPKRACSSYIFFVESAREKVKAELEAASGGPVKVPDIMKACGARWKQLSDDEKKPFIAKSDQDKDRYLKEMSGYTAPAASSSSSSSADSSSSSSSSSSESRKSDSRKRKKKQKHKKGKKSSKKAKKDPNAIRRPPTAYILYSQKVRPTVKNELGTTLPTQILKEIGQRWKQLSEEDKQPYYSEAEKLKVVYADAVKKQKETAK